MLDSQEPRFSQTRIWGHGVDSTTQEPGFKKRSESLRHSPEEGNKSINQESAATTGENQRKLIRARAGRPKKASALTPPSGETKRFKNLRFVGQEPNAEPERPRARRNPPPFPVMPTGNPKKRRRRNPIQERRGNGTRAKKPARVSARDGRRRRPYL